MVGDLPGVHVTFLSSFIPKDFLYGIGVHDVFSPRCFISSFFERLPRDVARLEHIRILATELELDLHMQIF